MSATQSERGENLLITLVIGAGKIIEEFATARHHTEKSAARGNILLVGRKVAGKMGDAIGEARDLHVSATGVAIVELKLRSVGFGFAHWLGFWHRPDADGFVSRSGAGRKSHFARDAMEKMP